jgi:CheY-like chemotaxis protein
MGRVLVIEPTDTLRQLVVRVLRTAKIDAVGIPSTADAMAACAPGAPAPDLILAVCHDPDPAAVLAVVQPIRTDPTTTGIPLIVATDDRDVIAQARSLGACECIVGAWRDLDVLVECVRRNLPR